MKNEIIVLIGLPASGKSFLANHLKESKKDKDYIIHSSDELRKEMFDDVFTQSKNAIIFEELHRRIRKDLLEGKNVIYDATNINSKKRIHFLDTISHTDCHKKAIVVMKDYNECIISDKARKKTVGSHVIERMYKSFQMPSYAEGFDEIEFFSAGKIKEENSIEVLMTELCKISQHNTHHTLTIGNHCLKTRDFLERMANSDKELITAGIWHDVGKRFCMQFKNARGQETTEAHFYGHESVSAYLYVLDAMTKAYQDSADIVTVANLIQYHMRPHVTMGEKKALKFIALHGVEFYNRLLLLHSADLMAK